MDGRCVRCVGEVDGARKGARRGEQTAWVGAGKAWGPATRDSIAPKSPDSGQVRCDWDKSLGVDEGAKDTGPADAWSMQRDLQGG